MRLKPIAAALAATLPLTAPVAAPAQDFGGLMGMLGGLAAGGPVTLTPRLAGVPTPVQVWVAPGPGPEGHLRIDGRARVAQAKAHAERALAAALREEAKGAIHIEGVRLSALSADARAFAASGIVLHAARRGGPVQESAFESRVPYAVSQEGLRLRPEGRLGAAPPALRAAFERLHQPVDLVPQAEMAGARLLSFTPSISAEGALEARAAFLASPQVLANFWALAGGAGR